MKDDLIYHKKIITSQWGEDGILEEIFNRIGAKNKFCVEFGAGNGKELSNVWNLIDAFGWNALLFEADKGRFKMWQDQTSALKNVIILNVRIDVTGKNSLDEIFARHTMPKDIDLLSIDIDSDDYHVFKELKNYQPRVVIIEHNPTIPPEIDIVQNIGDEVNFGASAKSLTLLAHKKGYKLAAATHTNCIFVHGSEFEKLEINEPNIEDIFDRGGLSYLISAINGTVYLANKNNHPSFTHFYNSISLRPRKKALHMISFGISLNKEYSKVLSQKFKPVRVFWDQNENTVNIAQFSAKILRNIINLIKK